MDVRAVSPTSMLLPVGGVWRIDVATSGDTPTVVVTLPDGTTATPTTSTVGVGWHRAEHTVAEPGRYVARASTTGGVVDFAAYATAATTEAGMPTVPDVVDYVGPISATEDEVAAALAAEAAAQRSVCRVRAVYPDDLREALLRRVARNLAMRSLPLAVLQGDAEGGSSSILPGRDPEVRRLEAPHRKLTVG